MLFLSCVFLSVSVNPNCQLMSLCNDDVSADTEVSLLKEENLRLRLQVSSHSLHLFTMMFELFDLMRFRASLGSLKAAIFCRWMCICISLNAVLIFSNVFGNAIQVSYFIVISFVGFLFRLRN